jgi:D-alanine-D-alanine ligase
MAKPRHDDDEMASDVRRQAVTAFLAIDGAGFARVDFLLSRTTGELFINEINTIPGFTTISMFSKMWGASGLDYPALVDRLIALALERHAEKQESKTTAF